MKRYLLILAALLALLSLTSCGVDDVVTDEMLEHAYASGYEAGLEAATEEKEHTNAGKTLPIENRTDLADYLTKKGLPFRSAYKLSGQLVAYCIKNGKVLEELTLDEFREFSDIFDEGVYGEISLVTCVEKRSSAGGTGRESVEHQIELVEEFLRK